MASNSRYGGQDPLRGGRPVARAQRAVPKNGGTEDQARAALRAFDGLGGLEHRIAEQGPWAATPGG